MQNAERFEQQILNIVMMLKLVLFVIGQWFLLFLILWRRIMNIDNLLKQQYLLPEWRRD